MEGTHRVNMVLKARLGVYINDMEAGMLNVYGSPIFDLFNVSQKFGVFGEVVGMIRGGTAIVSKKRWPLKVWNKAWALDDAYWHTTSILSKDNDLRFHTVGRS